MQWIVGVGLLGALIATGHHGATHKDWRPFAACLLSGVIGSLVGFAALAVFETAKPTISFVSGGLSAAVCALWWVLNPKTWHSAWDRLILHFGDLQMVVSHLILLAGLVALAIWVFG